MTEEKRKEIGKRLEKVRRKFGLTQVQFSEKFNMQQGTYNKYENGINPLSWEFVQELCKKYDIDSEWLYSGVGSMFKSKSENTPNPELLKAKDDEIELLKKQNETLDIQNRELGKDLVDISKECRELAMELLTVHKNNPIPQN